MDSFWDFFWFILSFFLLMAYLMVLFQILGDLFRDRDIERWREGRVDPLPDLPADPDLAGLPDRQGPGA